MSSLESIDEQQLIQAALEHPFESVDVPLSEHPSVSESTTSPPSPPESTPSEPPLSETESWQATHTSQLSEWRAQSASARTKAELTRAKWEAIRAREAAERKALGQPPESCGGLGEHITASVAAATETVSHSLSASLASLGSLEHVTSHETHEESASAEHPIQHEKAEIGTVSPSQRWEHISSSPGSHTSSYPSMSFPEASVPHSPSLQHALLAPTSAPVPVQTHPHPIADRNQTYVPPSTLPSITDNRLAPRTRLSLILSSLAINLLLPFINGVMLGFGEIFAKDVIVGWFGWKTRHGSTAAGLGLRR